MDNKLQLINSGKIPPQALDFEEAVLGAIMLEKDALSKVIDSINPNAFYKQAHQKIFIAIQKLFFENSPIDILTVSNKLKDQGFLDEIGGAYYITTLTNRVSSSANIEFHVKIIMQKFIKRELIRVSSETIKDAFEDETDEFDLLDKAGKEIFDISDINFKGDYKDMETLAEEAVNEMEKVQNSESGIGGIPSGFSDLDRFTSGWQNSDLIVLAARPGVGKTALALQFARNAANEGYPAAIFSLEMSDVQLMKRLISSESEIYSDVIKRGTLNEYDWDKINRSVTDLIKNDIFIDDTPSLSVFELRAKCRRLKDQKDIKLIVIDYIQLMTVKDNKGNREQEISTISRSLKAIAKELNIPVIVLSQLNRSVETRSGSKRPMLSDLRESGAIEQDADMVAFIYRPEYYGINAGNNGEDLRGVAEFIISKHRQGSLGTILLQFQGQFTKFKSINKFEDNPY